MSTTTVESLAPLHDEMTSWRHAIHAHPELGFEETRTSALVADCLERWGIETFRGVGRTGVVGRLKVGSGTRTVGLRADMDALPIAEANTFAHRSLRPGLMHACGHDGHTAMLLGAARRLAATQAFDGTVHFIFQPAEEGQGGAQAMLADGLFERFPCDAIFGLHNRPWLEVGRFNVRPGAMMAGGGFFDIRVQGRGSHGARPEHAVDPVQVAAQIAVTLQSVAARNIAPLEPVVVSVTRLRAGEAYNVIPETAELGGTLRGFSRQTLAELERHIRRVAEGTAAAFGATVEVDCRLTFQPLVNDVHEADFAAGVCEALVGKERVNRNPPLVMGSEDFADYLERVPGCFVNLGNGPGESGCELHQPTYDFNDAALPLGAAFFVRLVETRLARA